MKLVVFFLFKIILLFPAIGYCGAAYYVDPQAPSGGNGSYQKPWNSISQINNHKFSTSDGLYFKAGTMIKLPANQRINITWDGTADSPAVIGAYFGEGQFGLNGKDRPIISGLNGGHRTGGVLHSGAVRYDKHNGVGYVEIRDLHVSQVVGYGFEINGRNGALGYVSHCRIDNVKTTFTDSMGAGLYRTFHSGVYNSVFLDANQDIHNNYRSGTTIDISAMDVEGLSKFNTVRGNIVARGSEGIGNYKGARYTVIEDNIVYDCRTYHIYVSRSRSATIRNNLVYSTHQSRASTRPYGGAGIAFDCEGHIPAHQPIPIGENLVYDNFIASMGTGILIINNAAGRGVYHNNNKIYNNRIINCKRNFRIAHDDEFWFENYIEGNFSFIFSQGFVHVNNPSPKGVIWNNNYFNTAVNNISGNAGTNAKRDAKSLLKKSGWGDLKPGEVNRNFFRFENEGAEYSGENKVPPKAPSNFTLKN